MNDEALTIGQLAEYTGVTARAIRHDHQRGLLPGPPRDASGYRRYGAQAVLHLLRIKVLADAGVPLARIEEVLDADPERFVRSLRDIDDPAAIAVLASLLNARTTPALRSTTRTRRRTPDLSGPSGPDAARSPATGKLTETSQPTRMTGRLRPALVATLRPFVSRDRCPAGRGQLP